jgi:hypothetical protein
MGRRVFRASGVEHLSGGIGVHRRNPKPYDQIRPC